MENPISARYREIHEWAKASVTQAAGAQTVRIQVGSATCENAAGAGDVRDEFLRHVRATGRRDILVRRVGCTGRCSQEPIVSVLMPGQMPVKYQQVNRDKVHQVFTEHVLEGRPVRTLMLNPEAEDLPQFQLLMCSARRCSCHHGQSLAEAFKDMLVAAGFSASQAAVVQTNCFGLCRGEQIGQFTHLLVRPTNIIYRVRNQNDLMEIIDKHLRRNRIVERLVVRESAVDEGFFEIYGDVAFFNLQTRVALRNSGVIDPENIDEYFALKGFSALARVLERNDPNWVIEEIEKSRLRGRGGGGYPTATKWRSAREQPGETKYIICNADEGDPGAFMDRSMLEGDPCSVIEGMIIGGFAIGANRGFFYVRAEYPLAVRRLEKAIEQARQFGVLGKGILGSGFDFDLEVRLGAGAFVCGEETALIHSIEGERGQPRIRPPFPTESGLWGCPTVINNVETFANVPAILQFGSSWFSQIGTPGSGGTKVFALAGKVKHTGLVEVPMGSTLREIVFEIGGGIPNGKRLKAIQTGGPAGGCIRADFIDTPVDFDTLMQAGSIMGSGGMIVMDEDDCMVDIAKYFLAFSQNESCGKCTPCREGTKRMLEILDRITSGRPRPNDLQNLERLANLVKKASLCGLGRAAPNPVLSTLRYFREEFEAHVKDQRCPALRCRALLHYEIEPTKCVGCTVCARNCPVACISGERKKAHVIDQEKCIKCGRCFEVCRFEAVKRR